MYCNGYEYDIVVCGLNGWGSNNCGYGEDVGVYCGMYFLIIKVILIRFRKINFFI